MNRAHALAAMALLAACETSSGAGAPVTPPAETPRGDHVVPGSATPVSPGEIPDGGSTLRLDDPNSAEHIGRAPRRLDIDQFRASLEQLLGARWVGPQTVRTPEAPSGVRFEAEADLIDYFAQTLGRPDYITTTAEVLDPTVTFAKLASDAVRAVCAAGLRADVARPPAERLLLTEAQPDDALPAAEPAVRRNIAALALRLWGDPVAPESEIVTAVLGVFRVATARADATPLDGWRAVCIDLATDPRFLSY
jgi:hypothetical protein